MPPLERHPVAPPSVVAGTVGAASHADHGALGRLGGRRFDHRRTTRGLWTAVAVVVVAVAGVVALAFGSGSTIPSSDGVARSAALEEAAPLPADLTIDNEQEWTFRP